MTETSLRILTCVSNRIPNESQKTKEKSTLQDFITPSGSYKNNNKKKTSTMQTMMSIKKESPSVLKPPMRVMEQPTKFSFSSENFSRGPVVEKTKIFSKPKVSTTEKERQLSQHDQPSIFCARNRGSLLDDDDDDDNEDEWTLKKANPIYESDDEECFRPHQHCRRPLVAGQSNYQPIFLRWDHTRLSEDEIMGFYLGGLIRV